MSDEIDMDAVIRDMNRPQIPEQLPDWFKKNQKSLANSEFIRGSHLARPNSWINVETAAIVISTKFPKECNLCESRTSNCEKCGRRADNYAYCMTGNRDSDWLVIEMMSSVEQELFNRIDGVMCFFDPDIYPTIDLSTPKLAFASQQMVPVHIATLELLPYQTDASMLFIGDGASSENGSDFVAGILCSPGKYEIVAWLGWTPVGDLAPCALFAYGPGFADAFKTDSALSEGLPKIALEAVAGASDTSVLARMGNNQDYYAEANSSFYSEENNESWAIKNSWLLLQGFLADQDKWIANFKNLEAPLEQKFLLLESLRIRGQQKLFLEMTDFLLSNGDPEIDKYRELIYAIRQLPVGARYQEVNL